MSYQLQDDTLFERVLWWSAIALAAIGLLISLIHQQ
jgi:hypothetical protein